VPLWRQGTSTGINKYLYIGAAAVVVLMGAVLLSTLGPLTLPWARPAASQPAPVAKPAVPLASRSDFARADRFLTGVLPPAVAALDDVMGPIREGCNGSMTVTCEYAIGPAQKEATQLVTVVGAASIPDCIAASYARITVDAAGISGGLQTMQGGYDHNRAADIRSGLNRLLGGRQALTIDVSAAGKAQQAGCEQAVTGP